jgi:hypothetical protein
MTKNPTVGDLLKQGRVTEDDVRAAVEALLSGPATRHLAVGQTYRLYVGSSLRQGGFLGKTLRDPEASEGLKRAACRKAILLARPEKA